MEIKTYICSIHGSINDDVPLFDLLWRLHGCPICRIEKLSQEFKGKTEYVFNDVTGPEPDGRGASHIRCNPDDLEETCVKCGRTVYFRPYGRMDLPFYCFLCLELT